MKIQHLPALMAAVAAMATAGCGQAGDQTSPAVPQDDAATATANPSQQAAPASSALPAPSPTPGLD